MQSMHHNIRLETVRLNKMTNTCWVPIYRQQTIFFINSVPLWYDAVPSQKNEILSHTAICEHPPRYEQFQLKIILTVYIYKKNKTLGGGGQNH